jgi:hypothetical protein
MKRILVPIFAILISLGLTSCYKNAGKHYCRCTAYNPTTGDSMGTGNSYKTSAEDAKNECEVKYPEELNKNIPGDGWHCWLLPEWE